jgi:chemotaxis protein MotA
MEHGKLLVLLQPAELLIIFGSAVGTVVIANPLPVLKQIVGGLAGVFAGGAYTKARYLDNLKMVYELYTLSRKAGTAKLEEDVDNPEKSAVFGKYPAFLKSHHALDFLCDTLRMAVTGGVEAMEIDQMMEADLDVHHRESHQPISALTTMADSLPGLGIVAAVLGVVITMGALGGAKEEIGHRVAAALVGTFLGILLSYGVFAPLAGRLEAQGEAQTRFFHTLATGLVALSEGENPKAVVERARRGVGTDCRATQAELDTMLREAEAA